jgi:predicted nucleic acid binding AN1-type Zn finger protein
MLAGGNRLLEAGKKYMSDMLSYCGLICNTCPIYLATKETDKEEQNRMKAEIAKSFEKAYGIYFEASDIADCDGCHTAGGRLFSACNDCKIRRCAMQKMIENCAHCAEYVCKELEVHFQKDASAKERLDKVKDEMFRSHRQKRDSKYR